MLSWTNWAHLQNFADLEIFMSKIKPFFFISLQIFNLIIRLYLCNYMLPLTTRLISDLIHVMKYDSINFLLTQNYFIWPKIHAQCLIWNSNIGRYQEPAMPKCKLVFELSNRVSDSSTSILCTRHRAQLVLLLQSLYY